MTKRSRNTTFAPFKPSFLFYLWFLTHTLFATTRTVHTQKVQIGVVDAKKTIPQSKQSFLYSTSPPWNSSPQIDHHGFLASTYKCVPGAWEKDARIGGKYGYNSRHTKKLQAEELEVCIRQVPGDGNCLFHSLAASLSWVEDHTHLDFNEYSTNLGRDRKGGSKGLTTRGKKVKRWRNVDINESMDIYGRSAILRQLSVDMLQPQSSILIQSNNSIRKRERPLFLQGSESLKAKELLKVASSQYGMSGEEYCDQMRNEGCWGGGPEIVSICNYLKRPIHVYELISIRPTRKRVYHDSFEDSKPEFRLRRMACFGSPKFDSREPLHILSADCRFPDLAPGLQSHSGNHFMAVFPQRRSRLSHHTSGRRSKRLVNSVPSSLHRNVRLRSGSSKFHRFNGSNTKITKITQDDEKTNRSSNGIISFVPGESVYAPFIDELTSYFKPLICFRKFCRGEWRNR